MSAEVWERTETVYSAWCGECDWEGEVYLDDGQVEHEVRMHNEDCPGGGQEDNRTEREIFQDALDAAVGGFYA